MEQFVGAINSLITWLQLPAAVIYALALIFAAYEMLIAGGERGGAIGKKTITIATIAFIIVKGASVIATSLGGKINF